MNVKPMKNEKGFTLIELLVAMSISTILLGAAMYTYTKQDALLRSENKNLKLRDFARMAMDQLEGDLRMAGYGFPPGSSAGVCPAPAPDTRGVSNADATTITYRANTDNVTIYASQDSNDPNNTGLVVVDPSDFTFGDSVVFFEAENPCKWNTRTYVSVTTIPGVGELMGWGVGASARNDFIFQPIDDNVAVLINKYHTYTFAYNAGNKWITQSIDGGGAVTIATKVSSLTFSYFDANNNALTPLPLSVANLDSLRRIEIDLTVEDDDDNTVTATLITDVNLRNTGT